MTQAALNEASTRVVECDNSYASRWDAFVQQNPFGSLYHLYAWKNLNRQCFHHQTRTLAIIENSEIQGVFPVVLLKSALFGRMLCSMPFVNYGGPCSAKPEIDRLLLRAAAAIVDRDALDYLEIRSPRPLDESYPVSRHKVSVTMELPAEPEILWRGFKHRHRANVKRAYKHGYVCRKGNMELLDDFYLVIAESWRAHGSPIYHKEYFRRVVEVFEDRVRIFVVYLDNTPAAAALVGYFKGIVEGMWAGIRPTYRQMDPNYVLYWEMIKDSCERGMRSFHFGRSTADSSAEAFKKKWNTNSQPLYWHYYLGTRKTLPQLNMDNPKYRLAIAAWRRLPLGLTTRLGPLLARGIP